MRRDELSHIVRAAARILNEPNVVVIGSQSILASYPESTLPAELMLSIEADLMPLGGDDDADLIDGVMGEGSQFHAEFGIYGQGVSIETAILPAGWQDRLVPLVDASTNAIGWCLDPHDLCAAKLIAGRAKDLEFVASAVVHRLIDPLLVEQRWRLSMIRGRTSPDPVPAASRRKASQQPNARSGIASARWR